MKESKPSDYYTAREVADRMGVSKMTIYRMARSGDLPGAIPFGPRLIRIHKVTFDLYLAEQQGPPAGDVDQVHFQMDNEESETLR
ncbi:helix-turn-helix transcriptional regulator [Actinomadura violacea]|uniref:Helix-turn-helix domain-containing protein n=1 Tax=Actinomadura violacea TaxID=2819934 RepID=A0ABS3RRN1_9ACTN|nr:helix-turn-helix domain-containing protein [Actinomadura violacea]MBO2459387.1 helix-turn-helix domain-containing protein [Actinomadura violacea]